MSLFVFLQGRTALAEDGELACHELFSSRHRYAPLADVKISSKLRKQVEAARERVIQSLGFLPVLRHTNLVYIADVKLFLPGSSFNKKEAIGSSSYKVRGNTIEMSWTTVDEKFRNNGLSELMLAEILALHPETDKIILSDLLDTNLEIFEEASKTMKTKAAIRETYAYKRYARFGFSKIKKVKITESKFHKLTQDGKDFFIAVQLDSIRITFKRADD